jgi:V-ATPase subunit C
MDSEYLETIFIAVPRSKNCESHIDLRSEAKGFAAKYETLTPNVVPRSAEKLAQDANSVYTASHSSVETSPNSAIEELK